MNTCEHGNENEEQEKIPQAIMRVMLYLKRVFCSRNNICNKPMAEKANSTHQQRKRCEQGVFKRFSSKKVSITLAIIAELK